MHVIMSSRTSRRKERPYIIPWRRFMPPVLLLGILYCLLWSLTSISELDSLPLSSSDIDMDRVDGGEIDDCANGVVMGHGDMKNLICFVLGFSKMSFHDAEIMCQIKGGHLASIHSEEELDAAITLKRTADLITIWVGAHHNVASKSPWVWTDHTPWDFDFDMWNSSVHRKSIARTAALHANLLVEHGVGDTLLPYLCRIHRKHGSPWSVKDTVKIIDTKAKGVNGIDSSYLGNLNNETWRNSMLAIDSVKSVNVKWNLFVVVENAHELMISDIPLKSWINNVPKDGGSIVLLCSRNDLTTIERWAEPHRNVVVYAILSDASGLLMTDIFAHIGRISIGISAILLTSPRVFLTEDAIDILSWIQHHRNLTTGSKDMILGFGGGAKQLRAIPVAIKDGVDLGDRSEWTRIVRKIVSTIPEASSELSPSFIIISGPSCRYGNEYSHKADCNPFRWPTRSILPPMHISSREGIHWLANTATRNGVLVFDVSTAVSMLAVNNSSIASNSGHPITRKENGKTEFDAYLYGVYNQGDLAFDNITLVRLIRCFDDSNAKEYLCLDTECEMSGNSRCRKILNRGNLWLSQQLLSDGMPSKSSYGTMDWTRKDTWYTPDNMLKTLLASRARDNVVLLVAVNYGYRHMLENFLCMLQRLNIDYFVVACFDENMCAYCFKHGIPAFVAYGNVTVNADDEANFVDAAVFGSRKFNSITKFKSQQVLRVLRLGFHVFFSDVDIHFFIDPLPYLLTESADIIAQSNGPLFENFDNGWNRINSGFYFARATSTAVKAFDAIVAHSSDSEYSEQPSFFAVLCGWTKQFQVGLERCDNTELGVTTKVLSRAYYPNGHIFWNDQRKGRYARYYPPWDESPFIVHNNWCKGYDIKVMRFKQLNMWLIDENNHCNFTPKPNQKPYHSIMDAIADGIPIATKYDT